MNLVNIYIYIYVLVGCPLGTRFFINMIFSELNLEAPPLEHSGLPLYQRKQREEDLRNSFY